jgi:hypothetical protein
MLFFILSPCCILEFVAMGRLTMPTSDFGLFAIVVDICPDADRFAELKESRGVFGAGELVMVVSETKRTFNA